MFNSRAWAMTLSGWTQETDREADETGTGNHIPLGWGRGPRAESTSACLEGVVTYTPVVGGPEGCRSQSRCVCVGVGVCMCVRARVCVCEGE